MSPLNYEPPPECPYRLKCLKAIASVTIRPKKRSLRKYGGPSSHLIFDEIACRMNTARLTTYTGPADALFLTLLHSAKHSIESITIANYDTETVEALSYSIPKLPSMRHLKITKRTTYTLDIARTICNRSLLQNLDIAELWSEDIPTSSRFIRKAKVGTCLRLSVKHW